MDFQYIKYEKKERIAYVTLNRPQVLNCICPPMTEELIQVWTDFDEDPDLWIAIVTGAGDRAFSSGADMRWMDQHPETWQPQSLAERRKYEGGKRFAGVAKLLTVWKPVIAAVNGYCLGGGLELALACDIIIASENASFGLPEVTRGWPPGSGGPYRIVRQVPLKMAMRMLMTGDRISAQEAHRIGLATEVVPLPELIDAATRLAERINENPPLAVRAVKEMGYRSLDMLLAHPALAWDLQLPSISDIIAQSEDRVEGRRAFVEKRKPVFKGR